MALSDKQLGVFQGMALAMTVSVLTIILAIYLDPFSYTLTMNAQGRIEILGLSVILPTLCLVASIGRLAKFRFFSPDDIDGSALTKSSEKASLLQSLLQNTLEQLVITVSVYTAWCFVMPVAWLSAIPLCSVLFVLGRILFFKGYKNGAASRCFWFCSNILFNRCIASGFNYLSSICSCKLTVNQPLISALSPTNYRIEY